jgi:hypothetical protein
MKPSAGGTAEGAAAVVAADSAGAATTAVAGFLTAVPEGTFPLEPAAGVGCAAALAVVEAAFLADLAGDPDFAVASAAGLAGAEDAEIDGAGVAGCVVAEDAGADGAGCVVAEAGGVDSAGTAGFASAAGFEGAGVPAFEGAAAVAAAAFTACWQADVRSCRPKSPVQKLRPSWNSPFLSFSSCSYQPARARRSTASWRAGACPPLPSGGCRTWHASP